MPKILPLYAILPYEEALPMLKVFFGNMSEAVYNTAVYFKNDYEDE